MNIPFRTFTQYAAHLLLRNRPAYVVLFVTSRCNARCSVCFNLENVESPVHDELSLEQYRAMAKQFGPLPQLLLSGGEPFLRDDLPQIVEAFYRHCGTRLITIPTNGLLLNRISELFPQMLALCPQALFNLNISLDGLHAVHDRFRKVPGAFDKVLQTFHWAKGLQSHKPRFTLNISTTITSENHTHIQSLIHFVQTELRPDFHQVGMDRVIIKKNIIPEKTVRDLLQLSSNHEKKGKRGFVYRLSRIILHTMHDLDSEVLEKKTRPFTCLAGRKIIVVSETGEVFPCEPLRFQGIIRYVERGGPPPSCSFGNVKDADMNIARLLARPSARTLVKWIRGKNCTCHYGCVYYNSMLYSFWSYSGRLFRQLCNSFS